MKWGNKYSSEYVNQLNNQIKNKISMRNKVFCYTDNPDGVDPSIEIINIENFPYNFNKRINLFKKEFIQGLSIVCDLDIKIINDFSKFIKNNQGITVLNSHWKNMKEYKGIYNKETGYRTTINGSITMWNGEDPFVHEIYDHFMSDPQHFTEKYWGAIDRFVEWEHLKYNRFPNEMAFSHKHGPFNNKKYCIELFHKNQYKKLNY